MYVSGHLDWLDWVDELSRAVVPNTRVSYVSTAVIQ